MTNNTQATQFILPQEFTDAVIRELFIRGVINAPVKKKVRMNWESMYAKEFIGTYFPKELVWFRHEVGPIPKGGNPRMYKRIRRWADAIIYKMDAVVICEFKMKPDIKAVSQIYSYLDLFPETPEFYNIRNLPKIGMIVTTREDEPTQKLCNTFGIEYVIFKPSFYEDWAKVNIEQKYNEEEATT